jgi:hypothetical protein
MTSEQAFEMVRYKTIVEEIFQAWISKIQISTTTGAATFSSARVNYVYEN